MTRWFSLISLLILFAIPSLFTAQPDSDGLLLYVVENRTANTAATLEFVRAFDPATGEDRLIHDGMDRHVGWSPDGRYVWIT